MRGIPVGYWEQIGEDNRRHAEARARMNPRWRALQGRAGSAVVLALSTALWTITLVQTARWLF